MSLWALIFLIWTREFPEKGDSAFCVQVVEGTAKHSCLLDFRREEALLEGKEVGRTSHRNQTKACFSKFINEQITFIFSYIHVSLSLITWYFSCFDSPFYLENLFLKLITSHYHNWNTTMNCHKQDVILKLNTKKTGVIMVNSRGNKQSSWVSTNIPWRSGQGQPLEQSRAALGLERPMWENPGCAWFTTAL